MKLIAGLAVAITSLLGTTPTVPPQAKEPPAEHCAQDLVNGGELTCFGTLADAVAFLGASPELIRDAADGILTQLDLTREKERAEGGQVAAAAVLTIHYDGSNQTGATLMTQVNCGSTWHNFPDSWRNRISSVTSPCGITYYQGLNKGGLSGYVPPGGGNLGATVNNKSSSAQY